MPEHAVEFHRAAQSELTQTIAYYEERAPNLGAAFLVEVRRVIALITEFPESGSPIWRTRRRVLLDRFPYGVIYRLLDSGKIRILAVMHLRRRPNYWHRRS